MATDSNPAGTIETVKRELSIFDRRPFQVTHLKADWICQRPENNCLGYNDTTPILFNIPRAPGLYLDFNDSYLVVELNLVKADGTKYAKETYSVANNLLASLFRDVSMSINGTKIEGENANYSYKSYLFTLLGASEDAKQYQMHVLGWLKDHAGKFDELGSPTNLSRRAWLAAGNTLQLVGPLFLDICLQEQYVTDTCEIQLKLQRNARNFILLSSETVEADLPKINITKCDYWVRKVQVSPSVIVGHMEGLKTQNAVWPYNAHKIITTFHPVGITNISIQDCCAGIYPKCIIAGMVSNEAYNGSYKTSPYNFQHFNCNYIGTMINGQHIPQEPYTPDFANKKVSREYFSLMLSLGRNILLTSNDLTIADFQSGSTLFAFNYAPDLMLTGHGHPARLTNIRMDIKFSTALTVPIVLLLFCIYDTQFEITGASNVILDTTQSAN